MFTILSAIQVVDKDIPGLKTDVERKSQKYFRLLVACGQAACPQARLLGTNQTLIDFNISSIDLFTCPKRDLDQASN